MVVKDCQAVNFLRTGSPELSAVTIWGQVHGIVSLALEGQISHQILDTYSLLKMVSFGIEELLIE